MTLHETSNWLENHIFFGYQVPLLYFYSTKLIYFIKWISNSAASVTCFQVYRLAGRPIPLETWNLPQIWMWLRQITGLLHLLGKACVIIVISVNSRLKRVEHGLTKLVWLSLMFLLLSCCVRGSHFAWKAVWNCSFILL